MLKVRSLTVDAYLRGVFELEWEVEDTSEDTSDYRFVVLRAAAQAGPYRIVSAPLEDTFRFTDTSAPWDAINKHFYYRLRVRARAGNYVDYPDDRRAGVGPSGELGITVGSPGSLVAREMARREWLRLARNSGGYIVFPVRRFGTRCPECTSSGVQRKSNCRTCYDTTYLGGFLRPYEIPGEETPINQQILLTGRGNTEANRIEIQVPPAPRLYVGDVLVDMAGLRWAVSRTSMRRHVQFPVMQHAVIDGLLMSDQRYKLDADVAVLREHTLERLRIKTDVKSGL